MPKPPIGVTLRTTSGLSVNILEKLGDGGQGIVYKVNFCGKVKALKWYHDHVFNVYEKNEDGTTKKDTSGQRILDKVGTREAMNAFYKNIQNNIKHGAPGPQFLWPQAITEITHGSFGYIMDLRPDEYKELGQLLIAKRVRFSSYQARVNGMLNLVNAFQILHNEGYSYQDLNDGNFFFNPSTGSILICDNDNVAHSSYNSGVVGKCRFMAPEVVLQQKMPDTMTDRFSMAVILYYMLFRAHPLEGASSTPACLTPSKERQIYGLNPIFVFDPRDKCNRPVHGVADHSVAIWNRTPEYVKDAFVRSFSKEASTYEIWSHCDNANCSSRNKKQRWFGEKVCSKCGKDLIIDRQSTKYKANRLTEIEWTQVLSRFRNSIVRCANCGREEFWSGNELCTKCGSKLNIDRKIKLRKYDMPVRDGVLIYKNQLGPCTDAEAIEPIARVFYKDGQFGIHNISNETWKCTTSAGIPRDLAPGSALPAKAGIRVSMPYGSFDII